MKRNPKLAKKGNTKVTRDNGTVVRLHQTDIVSISASGVIVLNSGGWHTVTTKRRMNEASQEFDLGFSVYAKKGDWYIDTPFDGTIDFFDGVRFQGRPISNPKRKRTVAKKRRTAKQIAATRKLVAFNKKRRKKKTKTARRKTVRRKVRRKTTRKKNVHATRKRTALKKSHLWIIFKCWTRNVRFIGLDGAGKAGWYASKGAAILFPTKASAKKVASGANRAFPAKGKWQVGVTSRDTTSAQIIAACNPGK